MKVTENENGLTILPETPFETGILSKYRECEAFLKCGLSATDIIGIAVRKAVNSGVAENQQKQTSNTTKAAIDLLRSVSPEHLTPDEFELFNAYLRKVEQRTIGH